MTNDKLKPHKDFPEIWYDIDDNGNAYLVMLGDELLFDMNELDEMSPINLQNFLFKVGLKAGFQIAQKRELKAES